MSFGSAFGSGGGFGANKNTNTSFGFGSNNAGGGKWFTSLGMPQGLESIYCHYCIQADNTLQISGFGQQNNNNNNTSGFGSTASNTGGTGFGSTRKL